MDENNFKKSIQISEQENQLFRKWIVSLPEHEQQEWKRVDKIHEQVVRLAMKNNDAKRVRDQNVDLIQLMWKSHDVHLKYIELMTDHETYLNFQQRYQDSKNDTHTPIC